MHIEGDKKNSNINYTDTPHPQHAITPLDQRVIEDLK